MLTPAPRPLPDPAISRARFLTLLGLGLFGWAGSAPAQFHFKDYARKKQPGPDEIKSVAALLIDAQTGDVLYARNPDQQLLPASTTKLMTALIVFEKIGMKGAVTIIDNDHAEPSNVPVVTGETIPVDTLFHALLIESANDAARALGRYVAGTPEGFVEMMNDRAERMGCVNTHFYNPNGLPAPSGTHYSSCADLMKIFRGVIAHPELREICAMKTYTIKTESGRHILHNHNRLLGVYPGMGPAKTGWTVASKHTYACSVTRNGHELLLTMLDSPNKWEDSQILFNWAFAQYPGK